MNRRLARLVDWADHRTGLRAGRAHLLDEPLPGGTGWWFTTGSVLLFLLILQFASGIALTFYYVPSPASAYDSVRYLMDEVAFGAVVRGLHYFGASFIVIAAVIHMLRVVAFGSYKRPREVTWIVGVFLLLLILGSALTGYLLPWDQKAYWATTVTINVARSGPLGEYVAGVLRGGDTLGALTLLRWHSAHVFLLPGAILLLIVAHLALMRRHGISGPVRPSAAPSRPFYPYHALKDTLAVAAVFALLLTLAIRMRAPLEAMADPTDTAYVPRPEWYFLSLFQLLKYFPGPLEPIATVVIPGVLTGWLVALPFLDRRPERHLLKRPAVLVSFAIVGVGVSALTYLGWRDAPPGDDRRWSPLAIAGQAFAQDARCVTCHRAGGVANVLRETRMRQAPAWTLAHVRDPEMITAGLRPVPGGAMSDAQARAILSYMGEVRAGRTAPAVTSEERIASVVIGGYCAACHQVDGEGAAGNVPDLSHVGTRRDAAWLRRWIANPETVDPYASMPSFEAILTPREIEVVSAYLAARR